MQWTYDNPSNNDKDAIRLLIGDVDEDYPKLYDEEICFFLNKYNSVEMAAYHCVKAILTKLSTEPDYKIGPESVDNSQAVAHLKDLLQEINPNRSSGMPCPQPTGTSNFYVGMMDNAYRHY